MEGDANDRANAPGVRANYERIGPFYDLLDLPFEYGRYRALRLRLFDGLSGEVLDAGVGTGRNMPFYPEGCRVTGIDVSSAMLAKAARRRARLGKDVALAEMDVRRTTFGDARFDAVVASFLFCVLAEEDQIAALRELARVCKPGGEIRLLEYCQSRNRLGRLVQRLWTPWVRWAYGAAFDRQTERYVPEAGLEIVDARLVFRDIIKLIVARPKPRQP